MQRFRFQPRLIVWCLLVIVACLLCAVYGQVTTEFNVAGKSRAILFFCIGLSGLGLVFCFPNIRSKRVQALLILGVSCLLRICLIPTAPSDDIYRYLWEGKLVREGISPYSQLANDEKLVELRDAYWEQMNNLDKPTAYPPLSELIFAAVGGIHYSPLALKIFFILVELATIVLLIAFLHKKRMPLRWAGLYAFNAVALISIAGEAHFDVLLIFALLATVYCATFKKWRWAWCFLALAVQFKFIAAVLIPFLWKRSRWSGFGVFVFIVIGLSLPFIVSIVDAITGLNTFATTRSFNGYIHLTLHHLLDSRTGANVIVASLYLGVLAFLWFQKKAHTTFLDDALCALAALLVLSPTLHFWYLTWALIFIAIRPSLAWLVFSLTQAIYFLVWHHWQMDGEWNLTLLEQSILWLPFLIIGLYELRLTLSRRSWQRKNTQEVVPSKPGISVVIPTYNAEHLLPDCLQHLFNSTRQPDEIILADCGSQDNTAAIAQQNNIQMVQAPRGRGPQIRAGIEAAQHTDILVVHADSQIHPEGLQTLHEYLEQNPEIVGGSLGQRFDRQTLPLLIIEILNEARATLKGASFGDQGQFFKRSQALSANGFPDLPLMEDVEMSQCMLALGPVGYLGQECRVSANKWKQQGWMRRFCTVIQLVARYRLARILKPQDKHAIAKKLYDIYYPKKEVRS